VKVVFDMLGLNSFFRIFTNEDEAVNFLASSKGGEVAAAPQHAPPPPQAPAHRPPTGQHQRPPAQHQQPQGRQQPQQPQYQQQQRQPTQQMPQRQTGTVQRPATGQYGQRPPTGQWIPPSRDNPQVVACPNCGASFKVSQTGRYKCPSCATAFVVDPQFGVELAPATSQLTLAFTPECREGFNLYLGAMCRRAGYSEADFNQLKHGLEQILQGVLQNCYQGRIYESFAVAFLPARRNLQIKFIVAGPTLQGDPRAYFPAAAQIMPDLAMRPHPKGGTVVVMSFRR
jgi:hypothetical protein